MAAVLAIAIALWPARWGGIATLVLVSGDSMKPTLQSGDVVVVRPHDDYDVGEIVVYRVPTSVTSAHVNIVHRVIEVRPDGRLVLQGDNRQVPDGFAIPPSDVVGSVRVRLPKLGIALWTISRWWMLAALAGVIAALSVWPGERTPPDPHPDQLLGTSGGGARAG